jgi:signal peptidase I
MNRFKPEKDLLKELSYRLLSEGKVLRIRADGYSMYPQIRPGSYLLIEPVKDAGSLKINEIVVFKRPSCMVVHRLIRIEPSEDTFIFITRGDSCLIEDEPLNAKEVIGKVVRILTGEKFDKDNPILNGKINYGINRTLVKLLLIRDKIRSIFDY